MRKPRLPGRKLCESKLMSVDYPSFSIVIPTYQREDLVCNAVRSLSNNTFNGDVEIIVVIDGSTDRSAAALRGLNCRFPLRIIEQENRGLAAARNRGAIEASGDVLLFLDDDMIAESDMLEEHARSYSAGADAVAGEFIELDGPFAGFQTPGVQAEDNREDQGLSTPFGMYGGHMSVRRFAFETVTGFDESFTQNGRYGYEDSDLAYRLLQRFSIRRNPRAVSRHRKRLTAREYITRGSRVAEAELYLLQKHPELRSELIAWTGVSRLSTRFRLLILIPFLPRIFAEIIAFAADLRFRLSLRSTRQLKYLCDAAYTMTYWSALKRRGGLSSTFAEERMPGRVVQ